MCEGPLPVSALAFRALELHGDAFLGARMAELTRAERKGYHTLMPRPLSKVASPLNADGFALSHTCRVGTRRHRAVGPTMPERSSHGPTGEA